MGRRWSDPEWLDLGVRLRARRTELHLTREALAVTAQLRTSRLAAQERGATCVSAVELRRLAQALKAPINAFLREARWTAGEPQQIVYEALARSDEGAALAEAFRRIQTPRLHRHIVQLATELADQDRSPPQR
jgi:transcriptional regulator with XRE-family HTH domain